MPEAIESTDLRSAVRAATAELAASESLTPQSLCRFVDLIEQFGSYVHRAHLVRRLEDVTPVMASDFIDSPCAGGPASASVRHFRRTAVRTLYRVGRDLGLAEGDPTLDLALPPRGSGPLRALTTDEVELCRLASVASLGETRLPAAWALAEATARTAELSEVTASHVDLESGRVRLPGSRSAEPRWGQLSPWGRSALKRRICELGEELRPLTYHGDGSAQSRHAAGCLAISSTLARAGLGDDPAVRPVSVTAWAGQQILAESGRIDEVARRLGIRSLDRTARLVDFAWNTANLS